MADAEHLRMLDEGAKGWNAWRKKKGKLQPDLSKAKLSRRDLSGFNFSDVNLRHANLEQCVLKNTNFIRASLFGAKLTHAKLPNSQFRQASLESANLCDADLSRASLVEASLYQALLERAVLTSAALTRANLRKAVLSSADLRKASLAGARLSHAVFHDANLENAVLDGADLIRTDFTRANLSGCSVYAVSAWDVILKDTVQDNLRITRATEPLITVDNVELAQFLHLMMSSAKLRHAIDTITSKVVLILGRFTPERKAVLDAIRVELRHHDYIPILFDFDQPAYRDTQETITLLARMARFVIADITEARSIPQELVAVVQELPSLPVQPILLEGSEPWGMFDHIRRYPWVLPVQRYASGDSLIAALAADVVGKAERKLTEIRGV